MCKSVIVLEDRVYCPDHDDHGRMLRELGIDVDDLNAQKTFVGVKMSPGAGRDITTPVDEWMLDVDTVCQDVFPEWFDAEHDRPRIVAAVQEWAKEHIIIGDEVEIVNKVIYVKDCVVHAFGNSAVHAFGNSTVHALDYSTVYAYNDSTVHALDDSTVHALDYSKVYAHNDSTVHAYRDSTVIVWDNGTVHTFGNGIVRAHDDSIVRAHDDSTVTAYGNSTVRAYDDSTVTAFNNSTVDAFADSAVTAFDNSTVKAYGDSAVEAWDQSAVIKTTLSCFSASRLALNNNATFIDHAAKRIVNSSYKYDLETLQPRQRSGRANEINGGKKQ